VPHSITECWAQRWSRFLGSQSTCDSHKPGSYLLLLSARPVVTFPAKEHHCPL